MSRPAKPAIWSFASCHFLGARHHEDMLDALPSCTRPVELYAYVRDVDTGVVLSGLWGV
jgi:hypothetical protein